MIDIKDIFGNVRFSTPINVGSKRKFLLMKEDYVTLRFSMESPVYFKLGDNIDNEIGLFELVDLYKPVYNSSTGGYDYELRLDAYYWKWKNKIFKYLPETGGQESSWNLTAPLDVQMGVFLRNLAALGYRYGGKAFEFSIDSTVENSAKLMSYDNTNLINALTNIAKTWECEWWVTDNIINFGRCEHGTPVDFEMGVNVMEMVRADSKNPYATRIYAFGSTRNIPVNYRPVDESVVVNGVVQRRLMLPADTSYIDAYEGMSQEEAIEEVVVFDDIYPRRVGTISEVTIKEYTDTIENEDGTKTPQKWNAYRFKDAELTFSESYRLPEEELKITFQSGRLNGMTFAVTFNPHAKDEEALPEKLPNGNWNPAAQVFEIIRNEDYGRLLPDEVLFPQVEHTEENVQVPADKYILSGFDPKFVSDQMIPTAEQELKEKAQKYIEKTKVDPSTYDCKLEIEYAHGVNPATGELDSLYAKTFMIGQRVNLINRTYFENGRQSRIIGYEYNLDLPYDKPVYTVGETAAYSRIGELENKLDSLTLKGQTYTGGKGNGVYVIGRFDNTLASDRNVYSALRSKLEFLSKKFDDTSAGLIRFLEGIKLGDFIQGKSGGTIDSLGNAEFLSAVLRTLLRSTRFVDGMFGEGFQLWMDEKSGWANLTLDKLTVRQVMVVLELLIEKVRSVGGQFIVSAANGKIKDVLLERDHYKITFEQENTFIAHDLMRCATLTGTKQKSYWVEISSGNVDCITVPVSEFADVIPEAGDECVLMGNTVNVLRQNLISIAATEDGQPRIDVLDGVKTKNFNGCLRVRLGNLDGIKDDRFPLDNQPKGNGLYGDNVFLVGTFLLTTGEDILTKFEVVEGKIESSIEGLRQDLISDKSYLNNTTFSFGMDKWATDNKAIFFLIGNKWIWTNNHLLSKKESYAYIRKDEGRTVVHILNGYIRQTNKNFRSIPMMPINEEGLQDPLPVYLSFFYRCTKNGTLRVEFENVDKTGFADFTSLQIEDELKMTDRYQQYTCSGLWNGTGDFKLSFTGELYLHMLILSTDRTEALAYKYKTLFEQSERLVKISAAVFDKNEEMLKETGLVVKPEGSGIYMQGADGKLAFIGVGVEETDAEGNLKTVIKLTADNIKFEGAVTANNNFKILDDGSIETQNAKISGYIYSPFINIQESDAILRSENTGTGWQNTYLLNTNLYLDATFNTVLLPVSERYAGARALIMDSYFTKTRAWTPPTVIKTVDGSPLFSGLFNDLKSDSYSANYITIDSGVVEFILKKIPILNYDTAEVTGHEYRWILINNSCKNLYIDSVH